MNRVRVGGPTGYRNAVKSALGNGQLGHPESSWSSNPADPLPTDPHWAGELIDTAATTLSPGVAAEQVIAATRTALGRDWRETAHHPPDSARFRRSGRLFGDAWLTVTSTAGSRPIFRR